MPTAKQKANWARFARMARARARAKKKRAAPAKKAARRAVKVKVKTSRRNKSMAKKKGRAGRGKKGFNGWGVASRIADVNTAVQLGEPIVRQALPALQAGDIPGALNGAKAGAKEAVSVRNLIEAFGPKVGVTAAKKVMAFLRRI
jgi:hypothetical protein